MLPSNISPRVVAKSAFIASGLNFTAAIAMLLVLKPGLPVEGSTLTGRMEYLNLHLGAWWGGWLLWHAAAISLVAFFAALACLWRDQAPILTLLAPLLAAAGLAADICAEAIYMGVVPQLAPESFTIGENIAGVMTGYVANGLYTIGGILLTWAGARKLPQSLLLMAVPLWTAGLCLSAASLMHSTTGQFWSTAILMPLFISWTFLVGRWLNRRKS